MDHGSYKEGKKGALLVEVDVFAIFMSLDQLLDDVSDGHHHQLSPAEITCHTAIIIIVTLVSVQCMKPATLKSNDQLLWQPSECHCSNMCNVA